MDSNIALAETRRPEDTADGGLHNSTHEVDLSSVHGTGRQEFSLPPADGGKDAWLFLAGSFMIEALVWGFPFSFGLFQQYYSTHEPFASEPSGIASVGTTATGIIYFSGPVVFPAFQRWPQHRRMSCMIGLPIIVVALIASSFATKVFHLILTQGILYAIGGALLYSPAILFLDEWFVRRKGLAYGIMWAGTGVSGVVIPIIMSAGLERYGSSTMLRAMAVAFAVLAAPVLFFVKPRLPLTMVHKPRRLNMSFMRTSTFWCFQIGNILQGLGYFIPLIYLPTYAQSLGLTTLAGTLAVSFLSATSVIGNLVTGFLVDRLHVTTVILFVTVIAVLAVFLAWGFALSLPTIIVFSALYGMSAGGFSTTYTGTMKEIQKRETTADLGLLFGMLAAGRGIGAVASGPLSEALIRGLPWKGELGSGYGTGYGPLIVFTGITAAAGGSSWVARRVGWI